MGITKPSRSNPTGGASETAGPSKQYLKKGGKVGKKKMMYGGKPTMKKGGANMTKMKKGM
jgi:hypothetical protein